MQGLQQHLEATHDLFVYGFSRDHPDVVPTVNVHIAPDVYNSHGEFVQLDIDAYHMPANKVNGQRAAVVLWWAAARLDAGRAPSARADRTNCTSLCTMAVDACLCRSLCSAAHGHSALFAFSSTDCSHSRTSRRGGHTCRQKTGGCHSSALGYGSL